MENNNFIKTLDILIEGCSKAEKKCESLKKKLEKLKERFEKTDKKAKPEVYAKLKEDIKTLGKELMVAEKACK
jgi:predicted RNase H-like nuclease (RuvC/YqgF family)